MRVNCASCGLPVRALYRLRDGLICLKCALCNRRLIARSLAVAAVVGTILVSINQGDRLVDGGSGDDLLWRIPLTYAVPYVVATAGALLNARA